MTVNAMTKLLGVSDRTIQKHLADLEEDRQIKRTASFDEHGKQNGNIITYTGSKDRLTGKELTIEKLYDPENKARFRDDT